MNPSSVYALARIDYPAKSLNPGKRGGLPEALKECFFAI
jgi:hypothetical protein